MGVNRSNAIRIVKTVVGSLPKSAEPKAEQPPMSVPINSHSIGRIKDNVLVGDRIVLLHTTDPYTSIPQGTQGTVAYVDDVETIHVNWDNGGTLGIVAEEDRAVLLLNPRSDRKRIAALNGR